MTIHASLGGRNAGKARNFDGSVAIAAIDAFVTHVMSVAEGDRLSAVNALLLVIRRALHLGKKPQQHSYAQECRHQREARNGICAAMKNLGHSTNFP
jgi:hypothetical protein